MFDKQHVNKKNSKTWVKMNGDSRSEKNRNSFCKQYGGEFNKIGQYFQWEELQKEPEKRVMVFEREGEVFEVTNVMEFCRDHDLTKSAIYEVISGKRKQHKKFKFVTKK